MIQLRLGAAVAGLVAASIGVPGISNADVLYDQTGSAATPNADPNQPDFAPSNVFGPDGNEELTVDDFRFPRGDTWVIDQVEVTGAYHGTPPAQVNVYILEDDLNEGNSIAFDQNGIAAGGGPNYVVPVKGARLSGGTYWIGVQQAGATAGGYWSWGTSAAPAGDSARHVTPFVDSAACPPGVFVVRRDCYEGSNPDQAFRLSGTDLTLKLGKPKLNRRKGTAKLPATVHGPGELTLSADSAATRRRTVAAAGTTELAVKARGKAKERLNRTGTARVNAAVEFTSPNGRSVTEDRPVKLAKRTG